jgi:uncharacterized membrane protein YgcG
LTSRQQEAERVLHRQQKDREEFKKRFNRQQLEVFRRSVHENPLLLAIEDRMGVKRGVRSQEVIVQHCGESFKLEKLDSGYQCCCICLMDFESKDEVRKLGCKHYFHVACIDHWLKEKRVCPLCKFDILKGNGNNSGSGSGGGGNNSGSGGGGGGQGQNLPNQ